MFSSITKNQHYISQAEQRLNASNPDERKDKQRIFAFEVLDRDTPKLSDAQSVRIQKTLSGFDLFSFDVIDPSLRMNLENVFKKYESDIRENVRGLLEKLRTGSNDLKKEILDLFALKLLNFFRNPHCVTKGMNTFGAVANHPPTAPDLRAAYDKILEGSRPHSDDVCSEFGFTPDTYETWLRALFTILAPVEPTTLFDQLVKRQFEEWCVVVSVFDFAGMGACDVCLLSDRGFNSLEETNTSWVVEFNLSAHTFARFHFSRHRELNGVKMKPGNIHVQIFPERPMDTGGTGGVQPTDCLPMRENGFRSERHAAPVGAVTGGFGARPPSSSLAGGRLKNRAPFASP